MKLEEVQFEAARLVTGLPLFTSKQYLYMGTGWEKLSDRRERRKLTLFHKIFHNNTPEYLTEILTPHFRSNQYNIQTIDYVLLLLCPFSRLPYVVGILLTLN